MAKIDAKKESIGFLTKLFFVVIGIIVLTLGGIANLYLTDRVDLLFWLGALAVFALSISCLIIFKHIQKLIMEIESL